MLRYVHGSEDSLDVDVFYVFDEMPSFQECQKFCSNKEENRNIIVVRDGVVVGCFKGTTDEINNGLYYTYHLHEQQFPNVVTRPVERLLLLKVIRVIRCFLSHCSRTQYRSQVKEALKSPSLKFKIDILKSIDFLSIDDYSKGSKEDIYKIFAFQLGQVLGLMSGKEFYTKSSIAETFYDLKEYLYRKKDASPDNLFNYLNIFIEIISDYRYVEKENIVYFPEFKKALDLIKEEYVEVT